MKEFVLTQPYSSLDEMVNSAEVGIYKEELQQGNIEKYAIVSRIGNRYDLEGNKVIEFAPNPFYRKGVEFVTAETTQEDVITAVKENIMEEEEMKYPEIETLIDEVVAKQVEGVKLAHEEEIAKLKEEHAQELANAKAEVKAELLAKLNA